MSKLIMRGLKLRKFFLLLAIGTVAVSLYGDVTTPVDPAITTRDTLIYKDGDKLAGKLISRTDTTIVFRSDRFGELKVAASDAVIVPAEKPKDSPTKAVAASQMPTSTAAEVKEKKETEEAEKVSMWEFFSPSQLTANVRRFFGPYHGKISIAAESVQNTTDRQNLTVDGRIGRTWDRDEFQLNGRYSFSETSNVTTADLLSADALWRHTFRNKKYFAIYRPSVEANHAYVDKNLVPSDYILLHQEIGVGRTLFSTPAYQIRAGFSENVFTNWVISTDNHLTQTVESTYLEADAKLPWRTTLTDRSVYYYSFSNGKDGFENKFELDKKFTETLSIGLHYEVRYNNPDVRSADYNLVRLVFGFDF